MRFEIAAAACLSVAMTACSLGQKADKGILILKCTGNWSGTDTPPQQSTQTFRINFDTKTIERKHVTLGTWHLVEEGERVFHADKKTISYDGKDAPIAGLNVSSVYTLQFDRETGRVVDAQLLIDTSPGGEVVEMQFEGMCQPERQAAVEKKF